MLDRKESTLPYGDHSAALNITGPAIAAGEPVGLIDESHSSSAIFEGTSLPPKSVIEKAAEREEHGAY